MFITELLPVATFTAPEYIGTSPKLILWMFPLAAAIAVIYKVTKLPQIKTINFIKEIFVLFASIVVFILAAVVLFCIIDLIILQ